MISMSLRVVGAGPPRTGTSSLKTALGQLLDGACHHMSAIPGHPFDLGAEFDRAIAGGQVRWPDVYRDFVAAVDWPTSLLWDEISAAFPDAVVVLSSRTSPQEWWESMDATVLPVARRMLADDHDGGYGLVNLLIRFTGSSRWDDPDLLMAAYQRQLDEVRATVPAERLVDWQARDGWGPLCAGLGLPEPAEPFPWRNRREEWF